MDKTQALGHLNQLLSAMLEAKASDMFITDGAPVSLKIDGKMTPITQQPLSAALTRLLAESLMTDAQRADFNRTNECNLAYAMGAAARWQDDPHHATTPLCSTHPLVSRKSDDRCTTGRL